MNFDRFETAEDAFFWFIEACKYKREGARVTKGAGVYNRPCEPVDVYKIIDKLYRNRLLKIEHMRVLKHYGLRGFVPSEHRPWEMRSHHIWKEAMEIMGQTMFNKGIIEQPRLVG